jgi:hypothetical protein
VTFFEALKANETKPVKFNNDSNPWAVGELIEALNRGSLDGIVCASNQWLVVEEPLEFWLSVENDKSIGMTRFDSKQEAISKSAGRGWPYVALFREVPGTREEVKP